MLNGIVLWANMEEMMSENLAEDVEHDQEKICGIKINNTWIEVLPGTLELSFGDGGQADVLFSVERTDGQFEEGELSEIKGLKSIGN